MARWMDKFRLRLRSLIGKGRVERELADELRFHLEKQIEENRAKGMNAKEAHAAAMREFGGVEQVKEGCRDARGVRLLESLQRDIRFGTRVLAKSPGFSLIAIFTLALGIGANAAIFSIVESVLLRSLPFRNADRLVDLFEYRPGEIAKGGVPYPDYLDWKQQNTVFEETAAYSLIGASNDIVLGGPFSTERERYSTVTNSFFTILGVQPSIGHGFSANDEIPGGGKVFLVSDAVWRGVFGGDPRAIGRDFLLDGENFTLIGVMPRRFDFPGGCGIWVPIGTLGESGLHDRISHAFHVLGRLRPGSSVSQATAQIEAIQRRLAKAYPATDTNWRVRGVPLLTGIVGNAKASLFVLLGAVGFLLLIACANLVNLMLARASIREREFAIRSAFGATQMDLLRQNLAEALILVCLSCVLAAAVAKWGLALTVSLTSLDLPRMESFHLNAPVLVFMATIAAVTTILVGLAPAMHVSRQNLASALTGGQRSGGNGPRGERFRGGLVVFEIALTLVLLCGAGLLLRSFVQLNRVDPGFRPEHLLTMKIALPSGAYPKPDQTTAYLDRLLSRLRTLPGVQSAAAATTLPMSGESDWGTFLRADRPPPDWAHASAAGWRGVSVDYFRTLGISLLRGREFTSADAKNRNLVVINEAMAKKFWPAQNPIGRKILVGHQENSLEIIGIVADARGAELSAPAKPEMYTLPRGLWYAFLALRTTQEPSGIAAAVREQVAALDRGVPVYRIATMDELLSRSMAPARFNLFLLGLFASLALGLAAVGTYGLMAFSVSRRTHEFGVRLALGAQSDDILRLVLRKGMKLVLAGVLIGSIGAATVTRLMATLLFGVAASDPTTLIAAAVFLSVVGILACYIPARRAMRVDPMTALRHE